MHVLAFLTLKAFMPIYSPLPVLLVVVLFSRTPQLASLVRAGCERSLPARMSPAQNRFTCSGIKTMWKLYCKIINQAVPPSAACPIITHHSLELYTQGHVRTFCCCFDTVRSQREGHRADRTPHNVRTVRCTGTTKGPLLGSVETV